MKKIVFLFLALIAKIAAWAQGTPLPFPNTIELEKELRQDVQMLSDTIGARNQDNYTELQDAIKYIQSRFQGLAGWEMSLHTYQIEGKDFHNIVFQKNGASNTQDIILIGAHYDSAHCYPGADDNASAVAVLISLGHALANYQNQHTIRLVFFTLEEPPHFHTETMGSRRYAQFISSKQEKIKLMIGLEMLGYYSDKPIQKYPVDAMKYIYPSEGNFIAVVGNEFSTQATNHFAGLLKKHNPFLVLSLITPDSLAEIHLSDHAEFWAFGYPAFMVTDTSFYRNENYHTLDDTYDTLDYYKMAQLAKALELAIQDLDGGK